VLGLLGFRDQNEGAVVLSAGHLCSGELSGESRLE
jgi:hypothetical protein